MDQHVHIHLIFQESNIASDTQQALKKYLSEYIE